MAALLKRDRAALLLILAGVLLLFSLILAPKLLVLEHSELLVLVYLLTGILVSLFFSHWRRLGFDGSRDTIIWVYLLSPVLFSALASFYFAGSKSFALDKGELFHLFSLTIAASLAASAAGASVGLILQDYGLKLKRPLPKSFSIPSLACADRAVYSLTALSFLLLFISLIPAYGMVHRSWGTWRWEARTWGALLLFLLYGISLHLRRISSWRGWRLGILVILGFILWAFTFVLALSQVVL